MHLAYPEFLDQLDNVISIPVIPYRDGVIDYDAHGRNIDYLLNNNGLDGGRRRVICLAGTSPIHHVGWDEQVRLIDFTTRRMAGRGIYIAAVMPNPLPDAEAFVRKLAALEYPPEACLIMPLTGVASPEGVYRDFRAFVDRVGGDTGLRFLYYLRNPLEREAAIRLINESDWMAGVKIGTSTSDVAPVVRAVDPVRGRVIWGIGDRSTAAARLGAKGHTSGINLVCVRASDAINNAQRKGDFAGAEAIERDIDGLENIRFRDGRMYNYSAVVEALRLGGWEDVAGGEGAPFNPPASAEISREIAAALEMLRQYH